MKLFNVFPSNITWFQPSIHNNLQVRVSSLIDCNQDRTLTNYPDFDRYVNARTAKQKSKDRKDSTLTLMHFISAFSVRQRHAGWCRWWAFSRPWEPRKHTKEVRGTTFIDRFDNFHEQSQSPWGMSQHHLSSGTQTYWENDCFCLRFHNGEDDMSLIPPRPTLRKGHPKIPKFEMRSGNAMSFNTCRIRNKDEVTDRQLHPNLQVQALTYQTFDTCQSSA